MILLAACSFNPFDKPFIGKWRRASYQLDFYWWKEELIIASDGSYYIYHYSGESNSVFYITQGPSDWSLGAGSRGEWTKLTDGSIELVETGVLNVSDMTYSEPEYVTEPDIVTLSVFFCELTLTYTESGLAYTYERF